MLGVPPTHVVVTDDPTRSPALPRPADLITVHDPDHPGRVYRFVPETGHGGIYHLLDECPLCGGEVPVAAITSLLDLGRYLAAMGHLGPDTDADAPQTPDEFVGDPGHRDGCSALATW